MSYTLLLSEILTSLIESDPLTDNVTRNIVLQRRATDEEVETFRQKMIDAGIGFFLTDYRTK